MAIVANLALAGGPNPGSATSVDPPYGTPNRTLVASPVGVTTPAFAGEIVLDTASSKLWKAESLLNTGWVDYGANVAGP